MTHTLGLLFRKPSPEDLPGFPIAQVMVKSLSEGQFITPRCVSFKELAEWIEILQKELESIKKEARQKFQESN
jgi:hypothetical protein